MIELLDVELLAEVSTNGSLDSLVLWILLILFLIAGIFYFLRNR